MASIDLNIDININNDDNSNNNNGGYTCQTCGKLYMSVQALGGHQNAHRKERFALKRRHIEMKRQIARQMSILPHPSPSVGPSNMNWPEVLPAAAPYFLNSMAPPPAAVDDDVAAGLDLTLRL